MSHTIYYCATFEGEQWDMAIEYDVISYSPGAPASWTDPGYPAEYEFEIVSIRHDQPKYEAPMPVADGLRDVVEEWFNSERGYEEASNEADDARMDDWCYDDE